MGYQISIIAIAMAFSAPAFASEPDENKDQPQTVLSGQVKIFESEARDAKDNATRLREQAKRTREFVDTLRQQLPTLAEEARPQLVDVINKLEQRVVIEERQAKTAEAHAEDLRNKAELAASAVNSLPASAAAKPATEASTLAFGKSFSELFLRPNDIFKSSADSKPGEAPLDRKAEAPKEVAQGAARRVANAVSAFLFDRPEATPVSGASLSLAEDSTRLGLKLAIVRGGKYLICPTDSKRKCPDAESVEGDKGYQWNWSMGISSEAKEKFATLYSGGDDGGFDDNISLNLGFTNTRFQKRARKTMRGDMIKAETALRPKCLSAKREKDPLVSDKRLIAECSGQQLIEWAGKNEANRKILLDALWGYKRPDWKWGVNGEAGYKAFSYRNLESTDPEELDTEDPFGRRLNEETEFEWEINAHIGKFGFYKDDTPHLYGALIAELGQEYEYADEAGNQTVCPVVMDPGAFTICKDLNIAPPVKNTYYRIGFESKIHLPVIALVPKITIDVDDGQFGYELPILFVSDEKSKLHAGVKLAGESGGNNPDDFSFGLFLSQAFNIE